MSSQTYICHPGVNSSWFLNETLLEGGSPSVNTTQNLIHVDGGKSLKNWKNLGKVFEFGYVFFTVALLQNTNKCSYIFHILYIQVGPNLKLSTEIHPTSQVEGCPSKFSHQTIQVWLNLRLSSTMLWILLELNNY